MNLLIAFSLLFVNASFLWSDSIAAKKESLSKTSSIQAQYEHKELHDEMCAVRKELKAIYAQSQLLIENPQEHLSEFSYLLEASQKLKQKLEEKEETFRKQTASIDDDELSSLMHESEITLEQLIVDYASSHYLYVIPPEMAKIQVNLSSSLLIPKAAWEEIVELICLQNGIGIKPLNSFVKSLYWLVGHNASSLNFIASRPEQLEFIEPFQRICYILKLEGSEFTTIHQFLKRFTNERLVSLHPISNCLVMVGEAQEIKEINKLIGFIGQHKNEKSYKLLPIEKIPSEDVKAILTACFSTSPIDCKETVPCPIFIHSMKRYLLLMGSPKDLERADQLVREIQSQIASPDQMTVYWYSCKFSEPAELASVLQQVYQMMVHKIDQEEIEQTVTTFSDPKSVPCLNRPGTIPPICNTAPQLVVNPPQASPPNSSKETVVVNNFPNFIVDNKTGMIIMVIKQCYLDKLKELAKKLDVAKKMVQIEVLLFEKKINDQTQFGLNLFQLGDQSKQTDAGVNWFVDKNKRNSPGILDYFFGRKKKPGVFPAFNFAYHFLISQDDVYIHSNPTITTVNQTPAVIDLIEEQSLNMGTVEDPKTSTISNTYVRAQYGTFIQITPTVNSGDDDDCSPFITLDTNITFDTQTASLDSRPNVNRRHIQNQVRIANGETLILGGLRRKNSEDHADKIPFLGDIPGLGKLFSYTTLNDKSTEMFIFITPRVVEDPLNDFEKMKKVDLKKRPGDTPELLKKLFESKALEQNRNYRMSLKQLLGHV